MPLPDHCWCGSTNLETFGDGYLRCGDCRTLVTTTMPATDVRHVREDEAGLYGKDYWFDHQEKDVGHPSIVARVRDDLPERCAHWLAAVLRYKLPPARTLELGCAHGGFVSLMRFAGYDATGLELSPWIANYARMTFDVPVVQGPVEQQPIEPGSLDVIALFDVMEHLPDPLATLGHCASLLRPDGILMVQTPATPMDASYDDLVAADALFLNHMRSLQAEHLYLFSPAGTRLAMERIGLPHVAYEPAIFAQYDQFFFASRQPLSPLDPAAISAALTRTPGGRWAEALLSAARDRDAYLSQRDAYLRECEARLRVINELAAEVDRLRGLVPPKE
jgi:2-polyprenyl-3-methyl-5-hydroxy-6-metoxy-1,4-benzoquinol methylase